MISKVHNRNRNGNSFFLDINLEALMENIAVIWETLYAVPNPVPMKYGT
jgi:hypothetical protein